MRILTRNHFWGEWIWVSFIFLQHSKGRETFVGINGALSFAQMAFVLNSMVTFFIKSSLKLGSRKVAKISATTCAREKMKAYLESLQF
jgi:hypothetical protein